jgi:hypothetical protein
MISRIAAAFGALMLMSGCYVESIDDRPPAAPGPFEDQAEPGERPIKGECDFRKMGRGCLDAYVSVNMITVEGKEFHNVDTLASEFHDLIAVEHAETTEKVDEGTDFELSLSTPLDNDSFTKGFRYYVSGDRLLDGKVHKNHFSLNDLREGLYDIRIEKQVKFEIKYSEMVVEEEIERTVEKVDIYCASLFADTDFEISAGDRARLTFKDFDLHVTPEKCEDSVKSDSIVIP